MTVLSAALLLFLILDPLGNIPVFLSVLKPLAPERQRVVLARAIATDAPVLVLVEPTSAVDAHTEARIAERVGLLRRGRTTVVCTVSPLWLHHADRVVLLQGGRVAAEGRHTDLLEHDDAYRHLVVRALDDVQEVAR